VKRAVLGILAFAILAIAPPADSDEVSGWQEARWGMTPDEVQKALSYPTSVADLGKVCGEKCDEGAALELADYDLNGQHFMVRFWFTKSDVRLHTVSMYATKFENTAFTKTKIFLEHLYGPAKTTGLKRGYFTVIWELPSTVITLFSNTTDEMTVVYDTRTKENPGR
jgi:hypothetical protein